MNGIKTSYRRLNRIVTIFAIVVVSLSGGCDVIGYRYTKLIAAHTLLNDRGGLDMAAYRGALLAKFPPGSPVASLKAYVAATKGECWEREPQKLRCEIPVLSTFCVSRLIGIDALIDNGAISSLEVQSGDLTC